MKKILLILLILFLYLIASAAPDKQKRSQKSIHSTEILRNFP